MRKIGVDKRWTSFKHDIYGIGATLHALCNLGLPPDECSLANLQVPRKIRDAARAWDKKYPRRIPESREVTPATPQVPHQDAVEYWMKSIDQLKHGVRMPGSEYSQALVDDMEVLLANERKERPFTGDLLRNV
jgi:hypothetical protein